MIDRLCEIDRTLTLAINGSHSLFIDGLAVTATATVTWLPIAIVLFYVIIHNNDMKHIGLILLGMALCILIADQGASGICKPIFARPRPTQDPQLMYLVDIVNDYRGGQYGFFSSHAANTFSLATFTSLLMRDRWLTFALFSWALVNCWTRVYLGVHYVGDITVGSLYGILVGALLYQGTRYLTRRTGHTQTSRRSFQTISGYALSDTYALTVTVYACYVYVCFKALLFA